MQKNHTRRSLHSHSEKNRVGERVGKRVSVTVGALLLIIHTRRSLQLEGEGMCESARMKRVWGVGVITHTRKLAGSEGVRA